MGFGNRPGDDGLFQEPTEDEAATARGTAVEPENKLFQVGLHVGRGDRALVRPQDPPLEQAGDAVNARHGDMGWITRRRQDRSLVHVAVLGQVVVPTPSIGVYHGTGRHRVADEREQVGTRRIWDVTHPDSPEPLGLLDLHGNSDDTLGGAAAVFPPCSTPPTRVSSTSTTPDNWPRSARTMATRNRWSIAHAARYPVPNVSSSVLADRPLLAVVTCHAASNHVVNGVRVLSRMVPAVTVA